MKKILPAAAMLTMVGALASCTSTPAPAPAPAPVTPAPVADVPAPTPAPVASGATDTTMTGSTSTGTDTMTGSASTGATDVTATGSADAATATGSAPGTSTGTTTPVSAGTVHTKTVSYTSPAGKEEIELSVTVADGKITAVEAKPMAENNVSKMLQGKFKDAIATEVVGKEISKLGLKAVGGASLTTAAFTQYVSSL